MTKNNHINQNLWRHIQECAEQSMPPAKQLLIYTITQKTIALGFNIDSQGISYLNEISPKQLKYVHLLLQKFPYPEPNKGKTLPYIKKEELEYILSQKDLISRLENAYELNEKPLFTRLRKLFEKNKPSTYSTDHSFSLPFTKCKDSIIQALIFKTPGSLIHTKILRCTDHAQQFAVQIKTTAGNYCYNYMRNKEFSIEIKKNMKILAKQGVKSCSFPENTSSVLTINYSNINLEFIVYKHIEHDDFHIFANKQSTTTYLESIQNWFHNTSTSFPTNSNYYIEKDDFHYTDLKKILEPSEKVNMTLQKGHIHSDLDPSNVLKEKQTGLLHFIDPISIVPGTNLDLLMFVVLSFKKHPSFNYYQAFTVTLEHFKEVHMLFQKHPKEMTFLFFTLLRKDIESKRPYSKDLRALEKELHAHLLRKDVSYNF